MKPQEKPAHLPAFFCQKPIEASDCPHDSVIAAAARSKTF
jgi:hypothetical protein